MSKPIEEARVRIDQLNHRLLRGKYLLSSAI